MGRIEVIGNLEIHSPDENSNQFYMLEDLAELFGCDYQSEAVRKLKKELRSIRPHSKMKIDFEADKAFIRTSSAAVIFETAKLIHSLTIPGLRLDDDEELWKHLEQRLKKWKRPRPQKWDPGDIFSFQLKDSSFAFGQVIGRFPTCALLDLKSESESMSDENLKKARIVTILHLTPNRLNDFSWKVLKNFEVMASKDSGPWGEDKIRIGHKSAASGYLEDVANYYWLGEHDWKDEKKLKELIIIEE